MSSLLESSCGGWWVGGGGKTNLVISDELIKNKDWTAVKMSIDVFLQMSSSFQKETEL